MSHFDTILDGHRIKVDLEAHPRPHVTVCIDGMTTIVEAPDRAPGKTSIERLKEMRGWLDAQIGDIEREHEAPAKKSTHARA